MPAYSAPDYWADLHDRAHDESGVGYPTLPVSFNRAMYGALVSATSRMLREHGLLDAPGRVLDAGSGTGIWIDFWQRAGAREIVGLDLAEPSVQRLRARHPGVRFEQADLGEPALAVEGPFDLVSAMSVLLHIVDDARWRRALANLAGVLRPGGHLVLIEPVTVHGWWGPPFDEHTNSRARDRSAWTSALDQAGLELVDLRPATVLLSNVGDTRSHYTFAALWRYWGLLQQTLRGHETAGRVAGAVLGALDAPLRRLMPTGPSAKLLLARRTGPGA